jgi:hypothetical protein
LAINALGGQQLCGGIHQATDNSILPFIGLGAAMVSGDDPPFSIHESGDDLRATEIDS